MLRRKVKNHETESFQEKKYPKIIAQVALGFSIDSSQYIRIHIYNIEQTHARISCLIPLKEDEKQLAKIKDRPEKACA